MTFDGVTDTDTTPDSSLVSVFMPAHSNNYMIGRAGNQISEITIHHTAAVASSVERIGDDWQNPERGASSHYCVRGTRVGQFVKECNTAYTNGGSLKNPDAGNPNVKAVTIETCNSTGDPTWEVSDDTYYTLVRLVADIARRNNLGTLVIGQNLKTHQDHTYTICPGPYLLARMQDIADRANEINAAYISGRVYLRKHNTDKFFSVDGNNHVVLVGKDNAKPWLLENNNGKTNICDFNNPLLKMNVDTDETTLILTEGDSSVYASFLTEKTFDICHDSDTSTFSRRSNTFTKFFTAIGNLFGMHGNGECDHVDRVTDVNEEVASFTSIVPEFYQSRVVKIKHKTTGKYMTYTGETATLTNGYGISVELKDKVGDSSDLSQIWKITRFGDNMFCLSTYAAANHSLELSTDNNICVSTNPGMYVPNSRVISISEVSTGEFTISYPTFDKYCRQYFNGENSTDSICGSEINDNNAIWILEEPEPKLINDWLVAHYNPQDRDNARPVEIPNYAYRLPKSTDSNNFEYVYDFIKKDVEGNDIPFKFTNRNCWYAQEPGFSNYVPETVLNTYGVSKSTLPRKATQGTYKDYYWVAVGPNVIKLNYPDDGRPGSEMYGLGTLDAVISDAEGRIYYIHCIPGDVKAHSWNNGVFQTYFRYFNPSENTDSSIDQYDIDLRDDTAPYIVDLKRYNLTSYNKTACIEFIGYDLNSKGEKIAMSETSLNKYSIEKIIFYDNPIV